MFLTSNEIIETLNTLPEPVRTLAIHNHVAYHDNTRQWVAEEDHDYLAAAFEWRKTSQGYDYWLRVYWWMWDRVGECPIPEAT